MSKKSSRGPQKLNFGGGGKVSPPRTMDEIQREFADLIGRTGQLQYQIFVHQRDLESLNKRMVEINTEAAARNALEQAAAAAKSDQGQEEKPKEESQAV